MENLNNERKPLSELVNEAKEKELQIIIIGAGEIGKEVAISIANSKMMCVRVENLPEADQSLIDKIKTFEKPDISEQVKILETSPYIIDNYKMTMDMPEIYLSAENKTFHGFKRKKLKGYQKKK